MARKLLITSALSLLLAVHAPAKAQRTELIEDLIPAINPAFTSPSEHWADLLDVLPAVPATIEPFEAGWAFRSCSSSPTMYDYYNLFFEDCPEPWQVCLGKESSLSIEDVADLFGRIPVGFRQYIRDLLVPASGIAQWTNTTVIMPENWWRIYVMIHEATHAVDLLNVDSLLQVEADERAIYSAREDWRAAYYADQSTVTVGANTNWLENFAELGPRAFYDDYVEGGLANFQPNWNEFENQLTTFKSLVGDKYQLGGTCTFRIENTDLVPIDQSEGNLRRASRPDYSFKSGVRTVAVPAGLPTISYVESA